MTKKEKKVLETRAYVSVLRELTEEGREVSMLVAGSSMSPFLVHGRDTIYFKKPDRALQKGDMVFYQRSDGRYIMHRICGVKAEGYDIVGDAQQEIERPVRPGQIFAVVTRVKRKGKIEEPGTFWWEFFEHVWIRMIPVRRSIMKLYEKLRRQEGSL